MTNPILHDEPVINSSDILDRIDELEYDVADDCITTNEMQELVALRELDEAGFTNSSDWNFGCAVIRSTYFTEYIKDYILDSDAETFNNLPEYLREAIDWDKVAEKLKVDYTEITFNGVPYYILNS